MWCFTSSFHCDRTSDLELWLSNSPVVPDTFAGYLHPTDNPEEAAKYIRMTEIPYMEEKQSEALAFMRSHPLDTMRFFFRRFEDNWMGIWDAPADDVEIYARVDEVDARLELPVLAVILRRRASCASDTRMSMRCRLPSFMLVFPVAILRARTPTDVIAYPMDPIMGVLTVFADRVSAVPHSQACSRRDRPVESASKSASECLARGKISCSGDVVFLDVMAIGAIGHFQQFRGARAHTARSLQRGQEVSAFGILNVMF